jgi:hypothetical protein
MTNNVRSKAADVLQWRYMNGEGVTVEGRICEESHDQSFEE